MAAARDGSSLAAISASTASAQPRSIAPSRASSAASSGRVATSGRSSTNRISARLPSIAVLQSSKGAFAASTNIAATCNRVAVDIRSRGTQTKANRCRSSAAETSASLGRGRSVKLIVAVVIRSISASLKLTIRSCGSWVRTWASVLPAWPCAEKPNRLARSARCERSRGTCVGEAASAALVQIPAWTDSAARRPFS